MALHSRFGGPPQGGGRGSIQLGGFITPGLKWILIANGACFVVYYLARAVSLYPVLDLFHALSLVPQWVLFGALWQPVTYLFLHDPTGFSHIIFNSLMLWMFGINLERTWGTRKFLEFYFFCGIGAGLCDVALRAFFTFAGPALPDFLARMGGGMDIPTIGNSGAVYGVLLAFGLLFPDSTIYFWMLFPIPARIFVFIMGAISFLMFFGSAGSGVSHVAHLGGMLFGWLYLRSKPKFLEIDYVMAYRQWKLRRARRKFEVYMKKRDGEGGGGGPWVN